MCLNTGTPKNINFSFGKNGKLMALGVPILKHFRVWPNLARINVEQAVKCQGREEQKLLYWPCPILGPK